MLPCHPYRQGARCPHGRREGCWHRHDEDDPGWASRCARAATTPRPRCSGTRSRRGCGGGPPSLSSVRSAGSSASRRGSCAGWSGSPIAKVAEFQRRGAVHFHAVSAWTRPPTAAAPAAWPHHPSRSPPTLLEDALRQAVPAVPVPCPPSDDGPGRYARWGEQLDIRNITRDSDQAGDCQPDRSLAISPSMRPRPPRASAPASTAVSPTTRRRPRPPRQLPAHVAELVRACWELGGRPELDRPRS